jgi:hypothetical protein
MTQRYFDKTAAMAAFVVTILLLLGTLMHPSHADPNDAAAAFAEYAADQHWVASHLAQLFGLGLLMLALILLACLFHSELGRVLAEIGKIGAFTTIAIGIVLQAVDGIALKAMSVYWANAAPIDKPALFAATLGVRHIEIGLASMLGLFSGLTVLLYGAAMLKEAQFARWLAVLGLLGGLFTTMGGLVMAYTGFSDWAMLINMPANFALLLWALGLGVRFLTLQSAPPPHTP